MTSLKRICAASLALALTAAALAPAQEQPAAAPAAQTGSAAQAEKGSLNGEVVTGTMFIFFETRNPQHQDDKGQPKVGVQDLYNADLKLRTGEQSQFGLKGSIRRLPHIAGRVYGDKQKAGYDYDLDINFGDRNVGKWVGAMSLDQNQGEAYKLDGENPLRIAVTNARQPFEDKFAGTWLGKPKGDTKGVAERFSRIINGKTVTLDVAEADPMKFNGLTLAKGPHPTNHPATTVNGELSYDRETANYFARNLAFSYKDRNGKDVKDAVTGSIKWVEDPPSGNVRKGRYEFNLRFNEDQVAAPTDEAMFAGVEDEDLFFAVDDRIPSLTGTIEYEDTMSGESVTKSAATYKLTANKLTEQQAMNFIKLWLVAVGPVNDE